MTVAACAVERYGRDRLDQIVEVVAAAFPGESILADDLERVCFDDVATSVRLAHDSTVIMSTGETAVFGCSDGKGIIVATTRSLDNWRRVVVQLLAVDPGSQRNGRGRELMAAVEDWARSLGVTNIEIGGAAPFYLFTGVDTRWVGAQCFFEGLGYTRTAVELDLVCSTAGSTLTTAPGIAVERALSDEQVNELVEFCEAFYPQWAPEFLRGVDHGTVVMAREVNEDGTTGPVIGAAAHSVNRLGVIGPVGVAPTVQRGGTGASMMTVLLGDLRAADVATAEIAWTSTVRFYQRCCNATVGRSVQLYARTLV